jgi:hypothetical protein
MVTDNTHTGDAHNRALVMAIRSELDRQRINGKLVDGKPMTYELVAEKTGMHIRTVNRLLNDQRPFKIGQFVAIANVLGVAPADLMAEAEAAVAKSE